jgi:hypothetical protein
LNLSVRVFRRYWGRISSSVSSESDSLGKKTSERERGRERKSLLFGAEEGGVIFGEEDEQEKWEKKNGRSGREMDVLEERWEENVRLRERGNKMKR